MNEVMNNILSRRSIRKFKKEQIQENELELILKAGMYAPSAMNKQGWQFTAVQNGAEIEKLAGAVRKSLGRGEDYNFYQPPTLILVSIDRDNQNGLADCACALENMFLAAHSLGIGSCWINQLKTICDEKEIREVLNGFGIPENHIVWGMASIGYPEGEAREVARKDIAVKIIP